MNTDVTRSSETQIDSSQEENRMQGNHQKEIQLLKTRTILRPADLDEQDIPRITLNRLYKRGQVEKVAHVQYRRPVT